MRLAAKGWTKLKAGNLAVLVVFVVLIGAAMLAVGAQLQQPPPVQLTSEQDHQRMLDLLHISSIRRGADGDPKSPHAANYDEAKANADAKLPDPLILNNGKPITTAKMWWTKRRPEIVEYFDREVLGRAPAHTQ
jgi:hypothetical protein